MAACVAVVEDEPSVLELVRDVLAMEGHEPLGFNHPYQLQALTLHPDLFLVDIMLPDQTGIEVAQRLRDHGYADTPMLAMSASSSMLTAARRSGLFQDYLPKPFDVGQLLTAVDRQLAPPH